MSALPIVTVSSRCIAALLARHLDVARSRIVRPARLRDDLGASPLALVQVALAIEERFEVDVADNDVAELTTVGDVMRYVARARVRQRRTLRSDRG